MPSVLKWVRAFIGPYIQVKVAFEVLQRLGSRFASGGNLLSRPLLALYDADVLLDSNLLETVQDLGNVRACNRSGRVGSVYHDSVSRNEHAVARVVRQVDMNWHCLVHRTFNETEFPVNKRVGVSEVTWVNLPEVTKPR